MKKIELLSPAGSFEALKAAVNYGADAVYLGGTNFSARAFANNFNHEELIEAVKYCHLRDVKVYVTLNTLLSEKELENALNEARFYYENNVDALIIQDLGLYYRIKQEMPDFDLHASTQMHIHNLNGVKNASKFGFKKVVLARESNLNLIKKACKEDIDIECFIHGAICVSYSGQCLMSSVSKNRSANKGMCAQCCRLKYEIFDSKTNKKIDTDTDYLLSPKDMFLLEDIPSLIEAGVASLKIEGRLKSPAYVGLVTNIYRNAIDSYYEGKKYQITKEEYDNLLAVFNRGFTNSYLHNSNNSIFHNKRPNHMGKEIGKVVSSNNGKCLIRLFKEVKQFDGIRILNNKEDVGKILNTITVNGKFVSNAKRDELIEISIDTNVKKGDSVVKTLDHELEDKINSYEIKKKPIELSINFIENKPIIVSAKGSNISFKKVFDIYPDIAKNAPITIDSLKESFNKINDEPYLIKNFNINIGNAFLPKSKINDIRREFFKELNEYVLSLFKREKRKFIELNEINDEIHEDYLVDDLYNLSDFNNKIIKDPVINYKSVYKNNDICTEFGSILNNSINKTAYYTLNISNSYAYELLNRLGFNRICISSELNDNQINDLIDGYYERNNKKISPFVIAYGRRTLMYLRRNPFEDYVKENNDLIIRDYNNEYMFINNNDFNQIIEKDPILNDFSIINRASKLIIIHKKEDIQLINKSSIINA